MAVTLPFLLLLLDYWPLGRLSKGSGEREEGEREPSSTDHPSSLILLPRPPPLIPSWSVEKVPLLAIAGLFCLLAVHGQEAATLAVNQEYSFRWRIGNALISYVFLSGQTLLSGRSGGHLSAGKRTAAWAGRRGVPASGSRHRGDCCLATEVSPTAGRLALVSGDDGAGDRAGADRGRETGPTGSPICRRSGWRWRWSGPRRTPVGTGARFRRLGTIAADGGLVILLVSAWRQTALLARLGDTLDPHLSLHFAKYSGPLQSGLRLVRGAGGRRGDSEYQRPWKSSPTTPRSTTTLASPWRSAARSTRRWPILRKP